MIDELKKATDTQHFEEWAKSTELFRRWEQTKDHIVRHRGAESEKAGHDIGWHRALIGWFLHHQRPDRRGPSAP